MGKPKSLPSVEFLRECFDYNPETGELTWQVRPKEHFKAEWIWKDWNKQNSKKIAGHLGGQGYRVVGLNGGVYQAHRIIMKWMIDEEPEEIDHHDHDRANNCWNNLRPATDPEQVWNQGLRKTNTSGFRGVYRNRLVNGWAAQIGRRHLGYFDTPEEAAAVYEDEARELHGEFYCEPEYAAKLVSVSPKRRLRSGMSVGASGFRGVSQEGGAWAVRLWISGCTHYLGRFKTLEVAREVYCVAQALHAALRCELASLQNALIEPNFLRYGSEAI